MTVRNHVTFRTTRFNQTEVQPHFINPSCFGEDCIAWLIPELRVRGWPELTEAWQEDWGWQTGGRRDGRGYLVSVGLIPEDEPEWLIHLQERPSLLDRLLGRGELVVVPVLAPALHQVLRSSPDIHDVKWHYEDVFMRGVSDGADDPSEPRGASEDLPHRRSH